MDLTVSSEDQALVVYRFQDHGSYQDCEHFLRFAFFDSKTQSQIDHPCNFYKPVCTEKEAKLGGINLIKFVGSSNEFVLIVCKGSKKIEFIDYRNTEPEAEKFETVLSKSQ